MSAKRQLVCLAGFITALLVSQTGFADPKKERFDEMTNHIEARRDELKKEYEKARNREERAAVFEKAREFVIQSLTRDVANAWKGTPWTMAVIQDGLKPHAKWPGQPEHGISCSWFMVRALENVGLKFWSPSAFAGTISIHFQKSTLVDPKQIKRYSRVTPSQLKQKLLKRGDGLYVVGLNCHIGFIHVHGDQVDFIHSDYGAHSEVITEPITESSAIWASEDAGYVVSPLFHDHFLLDYWLSKRKLPFKGPKRKKKK